MKVSTTIQFKTHYVYVRRLEDADLDEIENIWRRIAAACEAHDCHNILVESFMSKTPNKHILSHSEVFIKAGIDHRHRIAWVHHQKKTLEDIKKIETDINKQGNINGRLFPNIEEALKWLLRID